MRTKGLFARLSSLRPKERGLSLEDFFTEVWAHVLEVHPALVMDVLRAVGIDPKDRVWSVETQAAYPAASMLGGTMSCRPDLRLSSGDEVILFEHKIDADQHDEEVVDPVMGERRLLSQLERYLAVEPRAYIVLVTRGPSDVREAALAHPRYVQPSGKSHFLWSDLYPVVEHFAQREGHESGMVAELLLFMRDLHMQPPRKGEGVIPSENRPGMEAERAVYARDWEPTLRFLDANGWTKVSHGLEIEARREDGGAYPTVLFDMRFGEKPGFDGRLKLRLRIDGETRGAAMLTLVERLLEIGHEADLKGAKNSAGIACIDVVAVTEITRKHWVGEGVASERLLDFTRGVLRPVHEALGLESVKDPRPA